MENKENYSKILKEVKCFLLDLDGTIYIDGELIGDMKNTLKRIRESGKKLIYLTNNSSRSVDDYVKRLEKIGIYEKNDVVYSSSIATTQLLNKNYNGKKVYLMGTESLKNEFNKSGIILDEESPDIVVVGYDTELTYKKLCIATKFLRNSKTVYIATHPDINCPAKDCPLPDVGSFIKLIEASTGRVPDIICGKPYKNMGELIKEKYSLNNKEIIMVGDRLYTDIMFGVNSDFNTLLVFSGETDEGMLLKSGIKPTITLKSLNEIIKYL